MYQKTRISQGPPVIVSIIFYSFTQEPNFSQCIERTELDASRRQKNLACIIRFYLFKLKNGAIDYDEKQQSRPKVTRDVSYREILKFGTRIFVSYLLISLKQDSFIDLHGKQQWYVLKKNDKFQPSHGDKYVRWIN